MFALLAIFLSRCDQFGIPVLLSFAGQQKSRSVFGGSCTIVFILFIVWAVLHSGQDLVYRQSPRIIQSESYKAVPEQITLSRDTFPFGFGLQANASANFAQFIDESIYKVHLTLYSMTRYIDSSGQPQQDWKESPIDIEPCTPAHFGRFHDKFTTFPVDQLYCLKNDPSGFWKVMIQGTTDDDVFDYVLITVTTCNKDTSSVPCADSNIIEYTLDSSWFTFYYADLSIDGTNYTNPDIWLRKSFYTLLSTTTSRKGTLKFGQVKVTTDSGWVVNEEKVDDYVKITGTEDFLELKPSLDGTIYQTILSADRIETHYYRSYVKLQESLAQAQGLIASAFIGLIILLSPYSRLKFYESLMNEIFHINLSPDKDKQRQQQEGDMTPVTSHTPETPQSGFSSTLRIPDLRSAYDSPEIRRKSNFSRYKRESQTQENIGERDPEFDEKEDEIPPVDMDKDIDSPSEEGNRKDFELRVITPRMSPNSSMKPLRYSQDGTHNIYSPLSSSRSPKSRFSRDDSRRTFNFRTQPTTYIEEPVRIEMKDIKLISTDENNRILNRTFSHEFAECEIDETKAKSEVVVKMEEEENKQEGSEQLNKEGEDVANLTVNAAPSLTDLSESAQNDESHVKDVDLKKIKTKLKGFSGFRRNKDKFNRLQRQYTDVDANTVKMDLSFWDFVCSLFNSNGPAAKRVKLLKAGISSINERLDVFNIIKKLREIDQLKALLLEDYQRLLFNGLPRPEINLSTEAKQPMVEAKTQLDLLKGSQFIEERTDKNTVLQIYEDIVYKSKKTKIDYRLIEIYDKVFNLHRLRLSISPK